MATPLQRIVNGAPPAAWEKCWAERLTPWDLGGVTPLIQHLVSQDQLPQGRCLVPGCGSGYDVLALASPSRHVVGLDISETALERAKELASKNTTTQKYVEFKAVDFFSYSEPKPFDLIFDYTFFCALEPSLRPAWAKKMAELLARDGELLTLMYPVGDHEGGPPYAASPKAYEAVLHPCGLHALYLEDNKFSIGARKGREILGRWKKTTPRI
ncbi:thiocyanate methyltransferase 1 isoform X1 [Selaginella moellendorffii]|uniref:thiocyanate methyltransferase 1 isoform X1 n=1 Tax=Selaginella moellendorffii TaxID=88036 RepID=UPI000D1CCF90|nr:thiocyanate methyltransferase 1 isoform X1 [Selaginella moellendorffii]|eukprot:XP_002983430.2 thiocyanate methyltransferase 1 isoform X1 [Selaginella moellendorffii]